MSDSKLEKCHVCRDTEPDLCVSHWNIGSTKESWAQCPKCGASTSKISCGTLGDARAAWNAMQQAMKPKPCTHPSYQGTVKFGPDGTETNFHCNVCGAKVDGNWTAPGFVK